MNQQQSVARLVLEDGTYFTGVAFGASATHVGEVAFNTSMTGYQEILTDPSYSGQIVAMTAPQIGNYGINLEDVESRKPQVEGFVVRELSRIVSNQRASGSLSEWLAASGVPGITGINTRALTLKLRSEGALRGAISTEADKSVDDLLAMTQAWPGLVGRDIVRDVAPQEASEFSDGDSTGKHHVVVIDCGAKNNILRSLRNHGCRVSVVPPTSSATEILALKPNGVLISNGPGDPEPVQYVINTLRELRGRVPMFGICLGHQLLALSLGARTFKLKFGHRGGNQPVRNVANGKVEITAQNHGFAVDADSIADKGLITTHINLNDGTLAGFTHESEPIFAVQYHPEACPGPHDADYVFDRFVEMMETGRPPQAAAL